MTEWVGEEKSHEIKNKEPTIKQYEEETRDIRLVENPDGNGKRAGEKQCRSRAYDK